MHDGRSTSERIAHDAAPLAKLVRDMARTFATGLPPLRDFGGSLSRYRYLVARAQLADLARVTLGSYHQTTTAQQVRPRRPGNMPGRPTADHN